MENNNKRLRVSVSVSVAQKKIIVIASAVPPLTAFHLVNLWTLLNAFSITFASAWDIADMLLIFTRSGQPMTTAEADDDLLRRTALLWCSTPQAVAGTLALLLPFHRTRLRRASAYAGLMVTIAGHCIWASAVGAIVDDDPEYLLFRIGGDWAMFVYALCDLLGFLALVCGGGEEQKTYLINLADLST